MLCPLYYFAIGWAGMQSLYFSTMAGMQSPYFATWANMQLCGQPTAHFQTIPSPIFLSEPKRFPVILKAWWCFREGQNWSHVATVQHSRPLFATLLPLAITLLSVFHFSQPKNENIELHRYFLIFRPALWAWAGHSSLLLSLAVTLKLYTCEPQKLPPSSYSFNYPRQQQ